MLSPRFTLQQTPRANELRHQLAALGVGLDVSSGKLSYAPDFERKPLPTRLCLLRHGETIAQQEERCLGDDTPLTVLAPEGVATVRSTAHKLALECEARSFVPSVLLCAPRMRYRETVSLLLEMIPSWRDCRLEEQAMLCGMSETGWEDRLLSELNEDERAVFNERRAGNALVKTPDGECFAEVLPRAACLCALLRQREESSVVLVAGGSFLGAFGIVTRLTSIDEHKFVPLGGYRFVFT